MQLSWNEVRNRATNFAQQWADASYEKGETQSFYNDFFHIFGVQRRSVARYEEHVRKLDNSSGFIDLFWPKVLIVEQKSAGKNLDMAKVQAGEYFDALPENLRPRFILVCDFQNFKLRDLDQREYVEFKLSELASHVEKFGFILGVQKLKFKDQDPANIKASELVGKLHDALSDSGYLGHDLERFLVRIVFCLFADDTGIFEPRDIFLEFLELRTNQDGADLGPWLTQMFQVLNTRNSERANTLDEDLARFPHINGELFKEPLSIPSCTSLMRTHLLEACKFDWSNISPAIFGALFQSVMDPDDRRAQGAHYTTEKNILKVITPLFLEELREEFEHLKSYRDNRKRSRLLAFQTRLGKLMFFDPACGCGNFLVIAYRELRLLEIDVIREIRALSTDEDQRVLYAEDLSIVNVDQFYGIEINEFPVRIAETALWMMDHLMNNLLNLEFGQTYTRIPIEKSPSIVQGDALEMDWNEVLEPAHCSYVFGNPPFVGAKYQSHLQRIQVRKIAELGGSGGTLDYVAAWFIQAGRYVTDSVKLGFVATNSICQGEQASQLWPVLFDRCNLEIIFAHRTFAWGSDARGKAHVHVVIIGAAKYKISVKNKQLFSYSDVNGDPERTLQRAITPYLFGASSISLHQTVVRETPTPLNGFPLVVMGSKPIDGGNYIFNEDKRREFLAQEPGAEKYFRPFIGGREFLQGKSRWILCLHSATPDELVELPLVRERMSKVKSYRLTSPSQQTQVLALTPTLYHLNVVPKKPFLVIPATSSEKRGYIPIGWLTPPVVPSNAVYVLADATKYMFALLTSAMHMTWLRHIGGRLKSDYRYSIGLVYNTFPPPKITDTSKLDEFVDAVLEARAKFPNTSLSDLYAPDLMPPVLRNAHRALDRAVDKLYKPKGFHSERERIEHLFGLYGQLSAPLESKMKTKRRNRR